MKKAKHLQRFWAFLLAFVLVSTTIASDGMRIVAAEGETTTEQTVSDPKTAEQTSNKGGSAFTAETEQQGETPQVEEGSKTGGNTSGGSSESSTEESVVESESSTETGTSGESVSTEDIVTTEEGTEETSTEVTTEVTTETETETFTETEGAKAETFTFTFDISGKGSVTDEEGNNVGSTVTGETGSVYKFNVEAEGTDVSILLDGNEIGTSNGSYEVAFDADKKITVTFAETESEVKEEKYTITFQITGNGKVTDTEGTEINSLTGKVNEELRFKVEAENADSKVTVKMDDKELTAADGVYTVQGKSDTAVNVNIEEPEKEEIAYTLYVEHFLDTNRGRYHRVDAPVELTEADFKDGKIDVSKYEFKRTGMVLVSAETLTKEDFDKDGKGYAEIHYKVADGWKIVDNRPSYRTIYLGNLDEDNPDIVPEGDYFTLKVKFSFEDGSSVANDFTAKYLIDEDSSKNTYTISVPKQEGYYPTISDTDVTLSADGTSLNGSYSEKGSREITVVYKVKQLQYTVKHAFEKADGTEYTVDDSLTETFSGDYGELTEAKAVAVDGFTPEEIANEVLTQDGIVITIKYDRNTYWLTYDANGGTYVARESGKYEQVMTVKGNDATTRVGYTFDGWYLDKELTKAAGRTIELKEDTVLYAKWEAKKVGYSIVYLAEDVNGAEGNHDRYIKTVYIEATNRRNTTKAGDKIVIPDWYLQNSSLGEEHYHQAGYNTNVIAKADGTSEVRVYYDLNVYNFIFNVATKYSPSWNSSYTVAGKITFGKDTYTGSQYRFQAKYGQNVSSVWPAAQNVTGTYSNNKKCYFATWGDSIATKRLIIGDAEVPDEHVDGASRTFKATWTGRDTMVVGHYFFEKVDGSGYVEDPVYKSTVYADSLSQKEIEGYIKADEYKDPEYKNGAWNYYFKYKRQSYKLYFYNDSTSPVRQETLKYGYPLTNYNYTPNAPTGKNDYTFGGWYDNSACEGARIDLTNMTMPKANLALYAKWIAPEYDVNFISEGKTLHTDKVEKGNTVNPYTDPVRNGYSFIGWYESTSPDAKLFDFAKPITKNTNIYAHWKANTETTYIVRYLDKNTGNPVYPETAPISGKVGSNVVAQAINVDGYFVDAKSKSIVLSAEAENNVIIFNYYKIGSVEFQYVTKYVDDNNNVIYSSGNLTTKDNILTVAADAKKAPGYIITPTRITKNMTVGEVTEFVFNCTAKSYNITYVNVEGTTWNGAGTNPNPSTYKTTDADITLVNPSKPGYEFNGWSCSVTQTSGTPHDPMNTVISTGSYGDLEFTASWKEKENITINYTAEGHGKVSLASESLAPVTGTAVGSTATADAGYHFVNWTNEAGVQVSTSTTFVPAKVDGLNVAATYIAHFEEDPNVTITYEAKVGGIVSRETETLPPATGEAQGSEAKAAAGYHFVNWTNEAGEEVATSETFIPAKVNGLNVAATYYANFEENEKITIKYVARKGGSVNPASETLKPATDVATGSTATASAGYYFVNWTNEGGEVLGTNEVFVPEKVGGVNVAATYYANFAEKEAIVINYKADENGTVAPESETLAPATGNAAGSVATPDLGYKLVNWTNSKGEAVSTDTQFIPAKVNGLNVPETYTAHFEKNEKITKNLSYTVEYWVEGEGAARDSYKETDQVWINDPDTLQVKDIEMKVYPGYSFTRVEHVAAEKGFFQWLKSLIPSDKLPETVGNGDIIKIIYTEDDVTIQYKADENGSVGLDKETIKAVTGNAQGSTATADNGYHFVNWTNEAGTVVSSDSIFVPEKVNGVNVAATYTAHFAENDVVVITYIARTGGSVDRGSEELAPATGKAQGSTASEDAGYTFVNWTNKAGDVVGTELTFVPDKKDGAYEEATYYANFVQKADVTINYEAKEGGSVEPASETLAPATGVAQGSVATAAAGYHFVNWTNEANEVVGTKAAFVPEKVDGVNVAATYYANFEEDEDITINYVARLGGSVTPESEDLAPATGVAAGSTAAASAGYHFVNWTDANGNEVGTDVKFVPEKVNGVNVAATYYANFAEDEDVTINYVANVGGSVNPEKETLAPATGNASGSVAAVMPGYHFVNWTNEAGEEVGTELEFIPAKVNGVNVAATYYANFEENENIVINYVTDGNGTVSAASESLAPVTGEAQGSTATANGGYHFVNWTNEAGDVVSTDAAFVPAKVDGLNVAATYTAHFAANPAPTPEDPDPNPNPNPTPDTTPSTTGVLGEALPPAQPEVGVLGEAAGPEVGVLGESKGPGTGDTAPIAGWSFLIMGAVLTLGITAKRRKKGEK